VSGSYRPASWGYHGGSPEEHPEIDQYTVYDISTGQEIQLDSKSVDKIESAILKDADSSDDYYEDATALKKEETMENLDLSNLRRLSGIKLPVAECGPMGGMGAMSHSHTPASISMSAGSGAELSGMLKDIMSLAGMHKVEPEHFGVDGEPTVMTAQPVTSASSIASAGDEMRAVLDKLHPGDDDRGDDSAYDGEEGDEEKTAESTDPQYDTTPNDPRKAPQFDANEFAHQENQPGSGNNMRGSSRTHSQPTATYESLMAEYKSFISEDAKEEDEEEMDEAADMDQIPAYVRKQKQQSQDAAQNATDQRNKSSGAKVWSSKRTTG